jgi:hypothetical protein
VLVVTLFDLLERITRPTDTKLVVLALLTVGLLGFVLAAGGR